jgi:hypothetical protein
VVVSLVAVLSIRSITVVLIIRDAPVREGRPRPYVMSFINARYLLTRLADRSATNKSLS